VNAGTGRWRRWAVLAAVLLATGAFTTEGVGSPGSLPVGFTAAVAETSTVDLGVGASGGDGASVWGPVGPPAPSNTTRATPRDDPAWVGVLDAPVHLLLLAPWLVTLGVEHAVEFADESPRIRRLLSAYPFQLGPAVLTAGISLDTQQGLGGSLSADVDSLAPGTHLKLKGAGTANGLTQATLGLRVLGGQTWLTDVGGGRRSHVNTRYYGLGPSSPKAGRSFFRQQTDWLGASHRRWTGVLGLYAQASVLYSSVAADASVKSDAPPLEERFTGELPYGYGERSEGTSVALMLLHDDTPAGPSDDLPARDQRRTRSGGIRRLEVTWFHGNQDRDGRFWTWRAEMQQFLPLWYSQRALALRVVASRIEAGGEVPFQRLLTNDDPDLFRGYDDARFRDRGIALASVEYRWPAWVLRSEDGPGVDAYAFIDYGQVFDRFADIATDRMTTSLGIGLRLVDAERFRGLAEVGWSEEGVVFRLRGDQTFQFSRRGLYHGRSPVPAR
jgi:hypothetical protein